jgi:hypothetical protein
MKTTMITAVGLVALAAVLTTGCSSSTGSPAEHGASGGPATSPPTTAAQPAAHDVEAPIEAVPWSQVGPGWTLATWSPVTGTHPGVEPPPGEPTPQTASTTLYLVNPAGGRYPITTFQPPSGFSGPRLADWSGDGRHALFEQFDYETTKTTMTEVALTTGAKQSFTVDGRVAAAYTRPTGQAILLSSSGIGNAPATLKRVDLSGTEQLTYPTDQLGAAGEFNGGYLAAPDGTQLVLGAANGLVVMGNDGVVDRQLTMPGPLTDCSPVRWWTPSVILARCTEVTFSSASQLWQVPLDGRAPTALTAVNSGQGDDPGFGEDLGAADAWQLPSGTFLQSLGACGTTFLSRLTPDMHTTKVTVPGVDSDQSVLVKGVAGDKLVLQATMSCGPGVSLLTYDPAANTSDVLLGPPVNGGSVTEAMPYPGQK